MSSVSSIYSERIKEILHITVCMTDLDWISLEPNFSIGEKPYSVEGGISQFENSAMDTVLKYKQSLKIKMTTDEYISKFNSLSDMNKKVVKYLFIFLSLAVLNECPKDLNKYLRGVGRYKKTSEFRKDISKWYKISFLIFIRSLEQAYKAYKKSKIQTDIHPSLGFNKLDSTQIYVANLIEKFLETLDSRMDQRGLRLKKTHPVDYFSENMPALNMKISRANNSLMKLGIGVIGSSSSSLREYSVRTRFVGYDAQLLIYISKQFKKPSKKKKLKLKISKHQVEIETKNNKLSFSMVTDMLKKIEANIRNSS